MKIVNKNVDELIPYENNPRLNDEAIGAVANSIKNFGFKVPIVIDSNNEIVTGHTRLKAAKKLGVKEVPCVVAEDLSPEQVKAFRLADNKVADMAYWDYDMLHKELEELETFNLDFDMVDFGFFDVTIDDYIDNMENLSLTGGEQDEFKISFVFPMNDKEQIENYIKAVGKDYITEQIIKEAINYD